LEEATQSEIINKRKVLGQEEWMANRTKIYHSKRIQRPPTDEKKSALAPFNLSKLKVPKYLFISWLAMNKRLQIQDRLQRQGITLVNRRFLCGMGAE